MQRESAELTVLKSSPAGAVVDIHSIEFEGLETRDELPSFKREIPTRQKVDRVDFLVEALPATGVCLHVGCSDAPLTEWSMKMELNLHARLLKKNFQLVGVDNSVSGLRIQRKAFPQSAFVLADVEQLENHFEPGKVDTIIAGEILEHLSNPGLFLSSARKVLSDSGRLVLTVPNVFGLRRLVHTLFSRENYHPDHVFYFSENTLRELADRFGFQLQSVRYYPSPTYGSLKKALLYSVIETVPSKIFGNHYLDGMALVLRPRK